ncbi:hypothetical protein HFN_0533 [Helicobacter fennelliae MRY12-0050]|uniref:Uncharacterized protein n=1 Tax=Helicobacter fennelliae MRY12-0050 TaxID=1325130 RepID=T1DWG8_9HELI|nr:hypothetical protein HFN_0533 [Helicobacter fennelliae MRY12-0050]
MIIITPKTMAQENITFNGIIDEIIGLPNRTRILKTKIKPRF